jgi:hypothetical protein
MLWRIRSCEVVIVELEEIIEPEDVAEPADPRLDWELSDDVNEADVPEPEWVDAYEV